MGEEDKIYIKLELCKDKNSDELAIMTHFNFNAPNFFGSNNKYSWMPTKEEMSFINEAFNSIEMSKSKKPFEKTNYSINESKSSNISLINEKEGMTIEKPPLEKTMNTTFNDASRNQFENNISNNNTSIKDKMDITAADRDLIEMTLKKHRDRNEYLSEFDEQRIIEKILNQKKQNFQK